VLARLAVMPNWQTEGSFTMTLGRNTFAENLPRIVEKDIRICQECKRVFNLFSLEDAEEWFYGHDCEAD
jgi:hypothetical protein